MPSVTESQVRPPGNQGQPPSAFWNCIITSEFKSVDTSEYALAKVEIAKYRIKRNLAMYKFL